MSASVATRYGSVVKLQDAPAVLATPPGPNTTSPAREIVMPSKRTTPCSGVPARRSGRSDLSGHRFGRLTVLARAENSRNGDAQWRCQCDCGAQTTATTSNLRSGNTSSCGCFRAEKKRLTATTHGGVGTRVYSVWKSMIQRCTNPNNPRWASYGGRGITVCVAWQTFENFRRDMGDPPAGASIDRIDNDRGYEPGNCEWSTGQDQNRNKRSNRQITYQGRTQPLAAWCEDLGLPYFTVHSRLRHGWSVERAFSTPVGGVTS